MKYYRVTKTMQYTETVYVKAESKEQANDLSGEEEGESNYDDTWYDSEAKEITKEEYEWETN